MHFINGTHRIKGCTCSQGLLIYYFLQVVDQGGIGFRNAEEKSIANQNWPLSGKGGLNNFLSKIGF